MLPTHVQLRLRVSKLLFVAVWTPRGLWCLAPGQLPRRVGQTEEIWRGAGSVPVEACDSMPKCTRFSEALGEGMGAPAHSAALGGIGGKP